MFAAVPAEEASVTWTVLALLTVPALVVLNGLFVATEFALVSLRKTKIEELIARGVKGAPSVMQAVNHLGNSIAATQLGITLASIGLGFVGEPALAQVIRPAFTMLPESWQGWMTHSAATVIAFSIITFCHVVFGELIPKTLALQVPDRLALWLARPLLLFSSISRPVTYLMNVTGNSLLRLAGFSSPSGKALVHSVEELLLLIEDTEEAGILDAEQADLVENIFRLSSKRVSDCLVPRDRMATLELSTASDQVLAAVRSGSHTRMPVYDSEPDNIVGIVNTKDLFYLFSLQGVVVLQDALYPPLFLRPDEPISNALRLFKKAHRPMAVVRDGQGHVLGLITLEDVLEEIVGDIEDEHDRPTPLLKRSALLRARANRAPQGGGRGISS